MFAPIVEWIIKETTDCPWAKYVTLKKAYMNCAECKRLLYKLERCGLPTKTHIFIFFFEHYRYWIDTRLLYYIDYTEFYSD